MRSVLLEIDEDSHPFTYAFLMWIAVVGGLWWYSRKIQQRDHAALQVDPSAQGRVHEVREQIQRQRSGSDLDPGAAGSSAAAAPRRPAAAVGEPREREDCPICISTVSWPVDTNCSHTFCAGQILPRRLNTTDGWSACGLLGAEFLPSRASDLGCFLQYHDQAGGVIPSAVKCPIWSVDGDRRCDTGTTFVCPLTLLPCLLVLSPSRRSVDVILPTEPGWTAAEVASEAGRKLKAEVDAYNARYSAGPRSFASAARDAPHYLRRFWTELTSGGEQSMRLMRQVRLWLIIGGTFLYLLAPLDLIPEAIFGLFGLVDDFAIIVVGLLMVAGVVRNLQIHQAD